MEALLAIVGIAGALAILGRLLGSSSSKAPDPDDARDVGFMTGMMGGDIEDAFIAQSALRRAQQERERREGGS